MHDLDSRRSRDLLEDIESRLREQRENRIRAISVVGGMAVVFALWFVPGYSDARRTSFALPLMLDQILFMAAIALGIMKVLEAKLLVRRFPYLNDLPPASKP